MARGSPILLSLALFPGCGGAGHSGPAAAYTTAPPADAVPLPFGKTALIGGLRLSFTKVAGDSRCPVDVNCVWAGDAEIELVADPPCYPGCDAPSKLLRLHTGLEPRSGEFMGFRIQLAGLSPSPKSGKPIPPADYVAWLRVEKQP
ncbi:MAG: hypothetical protein HY823_09090 [Acidobacteria bacterium]|nr:hypothetical protein [Acidobacteriota bacterium]